VWAVQSICRLSLTLTRKGREFAVLLRISKREGGFYMFYPRHPLPRTSYLSGSLFLNNAKAFLVSMPELKVNPYVR
jgi:hypothetical protein